MAEVFIFRQQNPSKFFPSSKLGPRNPLNGIIVAEGEIVRHITDKHKAGLENAGYSIEELETDPNGSV